MKSNVYKRHSIRLLPLFAFALTLFVGPYVIRSLLHTKSANAVWYNNSWTLRKKIAVANTGGTITNGQILLSVDTAALITAGSMQSDCDDIRLTDSDEYTQIQYWVEAGCNTTTTQVWVKIPSIPTGGKTIYFYYGNPAATNAEESWSGTFTMMNSASCPSGWSTDTNFDGRFPYGGSSSGTTGGSASHNHAQINISTDVAPQTGTNETFCGSPTSFYTSDNGAHTGLKADISTNSSVLPPYLDMVYCNKSKLDIKSGLISQFDTTAPSGWSRFTSLDAKFPRGAATYGGTGGSTTHTHSFTGGYTTSASNGSAVQVFDTGACDGGVVGGAGSTHTHVSNGGTTGSGDNTPPYLNMVFASKDGDGVGVAGQISMVSSTPPLGWTRFSGLDAKIPQGNSSYGGTGGTSTHTHSITVTTDGNSNSYIGGADDASGADDPSHTHSGTTTTDTQSNLPPYYTTVFAKRNTPDTTASFTGNVQTSGREQGIFVWSLDENSGSTANDTSGKGKTGTITNALWKDKTNCHSGSCLFFDGTGDYITRADDDVLDVTSTDSLTLEAWFRHGTTISSTQVLMAKYNASTGTDGGFKLYMDSNGKLVFAVDANNSWTPDASVTSTASYNDNNWHHVAAVKNANSTIILYIDGNQIGSTAIGSVGSLVNTDAFYVGMDGDGTSSGFIGFIDTIKTFRSARTGSQILVDMQDEGTSVGVGSVLSSGSDTSLTQGLVGYWKMDENTGTTVTDYSGNGNTGTLTNSPVWDVGRFGSGVKFDPATTDKYISVSASTSLNNQSSFTWSTWINPSQLQSSKRLLSKAGVTSITLQNVSSSQRIYFNIACSGTDLQVQTTASDALNLNSWNHVVVIWDGTSCAISSANIYINGKLAAKHASSTDGTGTKDDDSSGPFTIGNNWSGYTTQVQGIVDDTRVYNRALSDTDIRQLYNWAPRPIGWWKMDENTGTATTADSSGNGNSGTMTGFTSSDWVQGKFGPALNFDANDNKIALGSPTLFDDIPANGITFSTWVYPRSNGEGGANGRILEKINTSDLQGYKLYLGSTSGRVQLQADFSTTDLSVSSTNTLSMNAWHHIEVVWDGTGTASNVLIYLDGVLSPHSTNTSGVGNRVSDAAQSLYIGNASDGTHTFDGYIDDLKIYNYTRSPSQVSEDMNGGHPPGGSPVDSEIIRWKLDELQGATANNTGYGGSTYNGAITGASWYSGGKQSGALATSTSTNNVSAGDVAFVDSLIGMSIGMWVKPVSLATSKALISKSTMSTQNSFAVVTDTSTSSEVRVHIPTSTSDTATYFTTSGLGLTNDTWSYLNVVYNASESASTRVRVFKNGKEISGSVTGTLPDKMTSGSTSNLKVGASDSGSYTALNGVFDDIKIYPYALTYEQMLIDYNGKSAIFLGALSTDSSGVASSSASREFCVPGDASSCSPPIGWWKLDENRGTTAYDTSGNGNDAVFENNLTATDWVVGKTGSGISVTGTNKDALVLNSTAFDFGTTIPFTIGGWVKPRVSGLHETLITQTGSVAGGFEIYISETTNTIRAVTGVGTHCAIAGTTTLTDNKWHHIEAVYNRNASCTTSDILVYIDGIRETTSVSDSTENSNANINIGGVKLGSGDTKDMSIDNVIVYNYARTPAQIAWDYNRGAPIAQYKFDECTGTTAYNSAPTSSNTAAGNNGTITIGGTGTYTSAGTCGSGTSTEAWNGGTTGKFGSSLAFDGTNDYVTVAYSASMNFTTDISVSFWFTPAVTIDSSLSSFKGIMSKASSNSDADNDWVFFWKDTEQGRMRFGTYGDNVQTTNNTWTAGTWYHVVGTISGTNTAYIYVNGVQNNYAGDTSVATSPINGITSTPLNIGLAKVASGDQYFAGQIDNVQIFNYALTPAQVKTVYNQGAAVRFGP